MAAEFAQAVDDISRTVAQDVDTATWAAHAAARKAEAAAWAGGMRGNADQAITAAASGHPDIAQGQIRQLNQALAAHPDQGHYASRVGRDLSSFLTVRTLLYYLLAISLFTLGLYGFLAFLHGVTASNQRGEKTNYRPLLVAMRRQLVALPVTMVIGRVIGAFRAIPLGGRLCCLRSFCSRP